MKLKVTKPVRKDKHEEECLLGQPSFEAKSRSLERDGEVPN